MSRIFHRWDANRGNREACLARLESSLAAPRIKKLCQKLLATHSLLASQAHITYPTSLLIPSVERRDLATVDIF